jgi:excinuclease UvrABC nuclease subunit
MPFDQFFPRSLSATSVLANAPAASGIYGISNSRAWIYIGETDNIQASLLSHLQDRDSALMRRQPTGFVFEVCDPARRPARQDRLVSEYEPAYNRMP